MRCPFQHGGFIPGAITSTVLVLMASPVLAQENTQPGLRELEKSEQEPPAPRRITRLPSIIHQVAPLYPEAALQQRRTGDATLRITIDEEGYVSRVDVTQSAGEDLDWAAMGAVTQFVFQPAEVDGIPTPIQIDYRQAFVLKEETRMVPLMEALRQEDVAAPEVPPQTAPAEEPPPPVNFRGVVWESGTKIALGEAEVIIMGDDNHDTVVLVADDHGRFEARGVPKGVRLVRVAHTGHETFTTTEEFSTTEAVEARYFLPRRSYNKYETVVRDRLARKEVNRVQMARAEVSQVPGTFGDPLRAIENLPSMARAPLLGGQLLVRGTSPRSTGVYIDGVQVPLLYHFGALTSVVNPEFLETIDFYPGGFGAKYGRATAGIVDVKTRSLMMEHCRGHAKVDLMDTGFFFGCPVTLWGEPVNSDAPNPRRVTFAGAGRHSYIDALLPLGMFLFMPPGVSTLTVAPIYSDYQVKLEYRPVAAHSFQLIGFGSDDALKVVVGGPTLPNPISVGAHQQFHRVVGRWDWRIHPRMSNAFQVYTGVDWTGVGFSVGPMDLSLGDTTRLFGLRNELRYQLLEPLTIHLGIDYTVGSTEFASTLGLFGFGNGQDGEERPPLVVSFPRVMPRRDDDEEDEGGEPDPLGFTPFRESRVNLNLAPYVDVEIGPIAGLKLIPGFRFDYYKYGVSTRRFQPTPRLAARWEPIQGTVFKAAFGIYEQAPSPQEVSPNLGNPRLLPERSRQYVIGVDQRLTPRITVGMNGFYSDRDRLVTMSSRVLGLESGTATLEKWNNDGRGRVLGRTSCCGMSYPATSLAGWPTRCPARN